MKNFIPYPLCLILVLASCGQKDVLEDNRWVVVRASLNKQPMEVYATGMSLANRDNQQTFGFSEDGEILLPGLGTLPVRARWKIVDDKIHFTIDSGRYYLYASGQADLSRLSTDAAQATDTTKQIKSMIAAEAATAMEFFREPFYYKVTYDTLVMRSTQATLVAVRDKSLDELFNKLKPGRMKRR